MIKIGTKVLAKEHNSATTIIEQAIGLMFRFKVKKPLVFYFERMQIIPLHMMFVFTSIDVIFLDNNNKIVELIESFKPFTAHTPTNKASKIIELSPNTIKKFKIAIGQIVSIK